MNPRQKWLAMRSSILRNAALEKKQSLALTILPEDFIEFVLSPGDDVSPVGVINLLQGRRISDKLSSFLSLHWNSFNSCAHIDEKGYLWRKKDWDSSYESLMKRRAQQEAQQKANAELRESIENLALKLRKVYGFGQTLSEQVAYTFLTDKTGTHKQAHDLALRMYKLRYENPTLTR